MNGYLRAFLFAIGISMGFPLVLIGLALSSGAFAMVYAYLIAPEIVYAYPLTFLPMTAGVELGTSVVLSVMLSAVFAIWMGPKRPGTQFRAALACFAAWWLLMRVLLGVVFGLHPDLHVRM